MTLHGVHPWLGDHLLVWGGVILIVAAIYFFKTSITTIRKTRKKKWKL